MGSSSAFYFRRGKNDLEYKTVAGRTAGFMKKIDFLLVGINAKYIHLNPALYSLKYSVPETLRECVSVAEYTINHVYEHILMDIVGRQPDVIGISSYIWNIETVRMLCCDLAKVLPHVPIWLGGPEAAWSDDRLFE